MRIVALLLMGGSGERFDSDTPKQFVRLSGKPIYKHTLEALKNSGLFDEIIPVCHPDHMIPHAVAGGPTRQASSYQGLLAAGPATDIVLIHDAARPFVTTSILKANILAAKKTGAVNTCIPTADTIVQGTDTIVAIPDRQTMLRGQTPQTFRYDLILSAHQKTILTNATDDCRLVHEMGHPITIVPGHEENIKITTKLDLYLAEQIIRSRSFSTQNHTASLENKRFAVCGGTGGIGSEIIKLLEKAGALALSISPSSPTYPVDLRDPAAVKTLFASIGPLDGLINAQGYLKVGPLLNLDADCIQKHIEVNYLSTVLTSRYAEIKPFGHILNLASSSFSRGRPNYAVYSSAKAAIVNFTQGLAEERPELYINILSPGRTNTPMRRKNFKTDLLEDLLSPNDVAKKALELLSSNNTACLVNV